MVPFNRSSPPLSKNSDAHLEMHLEILRLNVGFEIVKTYTGLLRSCSPRFCEKDTTNKDS
jgi:hypothetical protein